MASYRSQVQAFVDGYVAQVEPLWLVQNETWWQASALGDLEASQRLAELEARERLLHADAAAFARLRAWRDDPQAARLPRLLRRQLELIYLAYAAGQQDPATIEPMTRLEQELRDEFNTYRAELEGQRLDDNALETILREERDSSCLRAAWEASKQVGVAVSDRLVALVRLRNQAAAAQGYASEWERRLLTAEIDPRELVALMEQVAAATDEAFARQKAALDHALAARYGVAADDLRPWHYQDRFFQTAPPLYAPPMDARFAERDLVALATRTYDGLGLDTRAILARSDLFPRPGKSQHAFAVFVDRGSDIRVLCNLVPSARWMRTLIHELGHAVYDQGIDQRLPYLLRAAAHALATEGLAMLLEEVVGEPTWLEGVLGLPADEARPLSDGLVRQRHLDDLVMLRWCLTIVQFERALYADPEQDLNGLWWRLVVRYQGLTPPPGRDAPDWASKIHLTISPAYYQNYLLGRLFALQFGDSLRARFGRLSEHRGVGRALQARLFRQGAAAPWQQSVVRATGRSLSSSILALVAA
ncbi:MAG: M2 family metallopeptidase [Chloroflexi bacterium]|nr:M2 family metallopeptidase [Chloroflexota bacterium]